MFVPLVVPALPLLRQAFGGESRRATTDQQARLRIFPTAARSGPDATMSDKQKILLIDDDALVAQLVSMLVATFRGESFAVEHVSDYAGGLEHLMSGRYALCLLDYRLGDGDGLQMLREAKGRKCPTPIILLTGDTREETDLAAMEGGAADFIVKSELK